jgi:hypothetical protein
MEFANTYVSCKTQMGLTVPGGVLWPLAPCSGLTQHLSVYPCQSPHPVVQKALVSFCPHGVETPKWHIFVHTGMSSIQHIDWISRADWSKFPSLAKLLKNKSPVCICKKCFCQNHHRHFRILWSLLSVQGCTRAHTHTHTHTHTQS